jgi:hypothetical protein
MLGQVRGGKSPSELRSNTIAEIVKENATHMNDQIIDET